MIKLLTILALVAAPTLFAEIIESHSIAAALDHVDADTLVVLDIDNTLITNTQQLGSESWWNHQIQSRVEVQGISEEQAWDEVEPLWARIARNTPHQAVEICTAQVVKRLRNKAKQVIGITGRSIEMAYPTLDELAHAGIKLSKGSDIYLEIPVAHHAKYIEGILFQGLRNDPGEVLVKYLRLTKQSPKKIVIVDDALKHLEAHSRALEAEGIPFTGIRLATLDEKVASLDLEAVEREWKTLFAENQQDAHRSGLHRIVESLSQRQTVHLLHN